MERERYEMGTRCNLTRYKGGYTYHEKDLRFRNDYDIRDGCYGKREEEGGVE